MSAPQHSRVIIIGSGPAGYTAAIYAARALLEPVLISGVDQGGQLMITTDVENYPGFAEPVQGPWLMEQMRLQAEHVGAKLISDYIVEAQLDQKPFTLIGDSGVSCWAMALTTPSDTELFNPSGLPTASTICPAFNPSESPNTSAGRFCSTLRRVCDSSRTTPPGMPCW